MKIKPEKTRSRTFDRTNKRTNHETNHEILVSPQPLPPTKLLSKQNIAIVLFFTTLLVIIKREDIGAYIDGKLNPLEIPTNNTEKSHKIAQMISVSDPTNFEVYYKIKSNKTDNNKTNTLKAYFIPQNVEASLEEIKFPLQINEISKTEEGFRVHYGTDHETIAVIPQALRKWVSDTSICLLVNDAVHNEELYKFPEQENYQKYYQSLTLLIVFQDKNNNTLREEAMPLSLCAKQLTENHIY